MVSLPLVHCWLPPISGSDGPSQRERKWACGGKPLKTHWLEPAPSFAVWLVGFWEQENNENDRVRADIRSPLSSWLLPRQSDDRKSASSLIISSWRMVEMNQKWRYLALVIVHAEGEAGSCCAQKASIPLQALKRHCCMFTVLNQRRLTRVRGP